LRFTIVSRVRETDFDEDRRKEEADSRLNAIGFHQLIHTAFAYGVAYGVAWCRNAA
jgi:hypothetical protein